MRLVPVEPETLGQGTPQAPEALDGCQAALIALDLEMPVADHLDLDVVAFFQFERFHDGVWKADRQAVAPTRYLHEPPP
jgi:hypothetical protein